MTKTFKFYSKKNNNTFPISNNTNYSKIIDNIILADIKKKNDYLFNYDDEDYTFTSNNSPIILTGSKLKADDKFIKAANFLANYKANKNIYNIPYELNKMYTLSDGTRIVFYDDEIQIGSLFYKYTDFNNFDFLNTISEPIKNIIIKITINIH